MLAAFDPPHLKASGVQARVGSQLEILLIDSTSSHISEPPIVPADDPPLSSPREVTLFPCQPVTEGGITDGRAPILQEANPS